MWTREGIMGIVWLNRIIAEKRIDASMKLWRFAVKFSWRAKSNLWGRFGGGWNWSLGFEAGGSTLIVNLLVCSIRFSYKKPKNGGKR